MLSLYLAAMASPEDEETFTKMYDRYNVQMMRFVMRILEHQQDAEDALQNAWIKLAENMKNWSDLSEIAQKEYIYKAIRSAAIDAYRKRGRNPELLNIDDLIDCSAEIDIPNEYMRNEEFLRIISILNHIPPPYRDVLSLYWLGNSKPKQIAGILQRPFETVKSQLKRGNAMLQEQLKKEGYLHDTERNSTPQTSTVDN